MQSIDELEADLSTPSSGLVEDMRELKGDLVVLGAGGKLGPTLVQLAMRSLAVAGSTSKVIAVSRFSSPESRAVIEKSGATALPADLSNEQDLAGLPDAENVVFLVGTKFGSTGSEHRTWFTNTYLPGRIAEKYQGSRISVLSSGNLYPLVSLRTGGAKEDTPPGPVGEYAMSCLGRERVFSAFSERNGTPMAFIRLNWATEMRYGILVDLATYIAKGEPIDITTGFANAVWQGYANEVSLRALLHASAPPFVLNVTGPETFSLRQVATELAKRMGREAEFTGSEADTALLSNAAACHRLFGYPSKTLEQLIDRTADWVGNGGVSLNKPTKFQVRDGKF